MPDKTRLHYQEELESLEQTALGGLDLVVQSLDRALEAVEHQDVELAELVVADDDRIDGRYLEVHQAILTLLATQAPVATDLRLISALLHVMKCMERMGDQCVNIAKLIPLTGYDAPQRAEMLDRIMQMGKQVRSQVTAVEEGLRGSRRRAGPRPGAPGRRRRRPQQGVLPDRRRDGRRQGHPRVGDDDDASSPAPSSAPATTPSTSASRSPSSSRASSASSRTPRIPARPRLPHRRSGSGGDLRGEGAQRARR